MFYFFKRVGTLQLLGHGAMVNHAVLWCGESVFDSTLIVWSVYQYIRNSGELQFDDQYLRCLMIDFDLKAKV